MAVGSAVRRTSLLAGVALALLPGTARAQQGVPDSAQVARQLRELEQARTRFVERMKGLESKLATQLDAQARLMASVERDVARASALAPARRDSILRAAEPRLNEVARRLADVQREIESVVTKQLDRDLFAIYGGAREVSSVEEARVLRQLTGDVTRIVMQASNAARVLAAQQAALAWRAATEPPRGRIGVTLSGGQYTWVRDGTLWTRYIGPQVVEAVEPGGPADKAGLEAGDTLLALGKHRVDDGDVPLGALLVPGETLPLTLRRRGQEKRVTLVVGERTGAFALVPAVVCPPGTMCGTRAVVGRAGDGATVPVPPRTPPSPATATTAGATSWSYTFDNSLAGAVLATIDTDLEELLGTDDGALVLRVAPGSPAAEAGLRGGDVIVSVDEVAVDSPREVQRAMRKVANAGARGLRLVVVRKGVTRKVELKW